MGIHRIVSTEAIDLTASTPSNTSAKTYPWTARIVADVAVHVLVGAIGDTNPEADDEDYPVIEFEESLIAVEAGCEVSFYASENGTVWISEVKCSS